MYENLVSETNTHVNLGNAAHYEVVRAPIDEAVAKMLGGDSEFTVDGQAPKSLSINNGSDWWWPSRRARTDSVVPVAVEIVTAKVHLR